jgi:acyl-CoA thioester hydrolase
MTARPWPDVAGRMVDGVHVLPVRVYYEDTDFSGVVYHGSYVRFMERGRTDFLRVVGVGHDTLADENGEPLVFAVRRMQIEFLRPARIDDLIEVETRPGKLTGARAVVHQTIRRGDDILVTAEVTVVVLNGSGQLARMPAALSRRIAEGSV